MFKTAYHDKLVGKKVMTLFHDDSGFHLVSQFTGAIEPLSIRGFLSILSDFIHY